MLKLLKLILLKLNTLIRRWLFDSKTPRGSLHSPWSEIFI